MNVRRTVWLQLFIVLCFIVMLGRLWWLQLIGISVASGERGAIAASVWQREQGIILDSGRGHFLDRASRHLTGETYLTVVLFPQVRDEGDLRAYGQLATRLGTTLTSWQERVASLDGPSFWIPAGASDPIRLDEATADAIDELDLAGVVVAPYTQRYLDKAPASQLIGFIGENPERISELYARELQQGSMKLSSELGASGLELAFDSYLQAGEPTTLSLFTDGQRRLLEGRSLRIYQPTNPFLPIDVVTTIDLDIQQDVEAILDRYGVADGAVVVLDAKEGDIVAMSSRPAYRPDAVNLKQNGWSNRAIKEAVPGSVFKTVIAATALEYGLVEPDDHFFCPGELGRYGLSCWKQGGHGDLTMAEAFAESCNVAFAKLMERLTSEQVELTAHKLGIEMTVGWSDVVGGQQFRQLDGEEAGQIFSSLTDKHDGGVRAQTSIGQRDVRMTPLQAANLMLTVLHAGEVTSPRAVSELIYANGARMKDYATKTLVSRKDGISRETASILRDWMRLVVLQGTGQSLSAREWSIAGKSGTAQVPAKLGDGENEWFAGFAPYENPRYSAAVMLHKSREDSVHEATLIFGDIMDSLSKRQP